MHEQRKLFEPWRCVLVGDETILIECGKILLERGHEIVAVASERAFIADWAEANFIRHLSHAREIEGSGIGGFDYLFSIANLNILPEGLLALPRRGAINFHDGPLPRYPGLNAPVRALLNGEAQHGITWHRMMREVDAGAILGTRTFPIDPGETAFSLNTKCFAAAIESFAQLVDGLAADLVIEVSQDAGTLFAERYGDRTAGAGMIPLSANAAEVERFVRALDFGSHANPVALPTLLFQGQTATVRKAAMIGQASGEAPGTILRVDTDAVTVATGGGDIRLQDWFVAPQALGLAVGQRFDMPSAEQQTSLSRLAAAFAAQEKYWRKRLKALDPLPMDCFDRQPGSGTGALDQVLPGGSLAIFASILGYLARIHDRGRFDIGYCDPVLSMRIEGLEPWFAPVLPISVEIDFRGNVTKLREGLSDVLAQTHRRLGYRADLPLRMGEEFGGRDAALPVVLKIVDQFAETPLPAGCKLMVAIRADGTMARWVFDRAHLDEGAVAMMQAGSLALHRQAEDEPERPVAELTLGAVPASAGVAVEWRQDAPVHQLFSEMAVRAPSAIAVTCRGESLTYEELDRRSNQFGRYLQRRGVGPDVLVGLHCDRSLDLIVALMGIWKAGGAYVPLDPAYPAPRIRHMIEDAALKVIITRSQLLPLLGQGSAICIDSEWSAITAEDDSALPASSGPDNLAYVIFTSGSTGKPKGVMVEHRNVVNFFAGMDQHIARQGNWLAVTSLSFDISVLELCWTLTRGLHVVLATGNEMKPAAPPRRPMDFSLFYFAADEASDATEKYRLLLEGARFADQNGFAAVWTPERHFHAFGGLYPNPAVAGAAVAAITSRVQIRGGSVVLPLHHPARVAEEWSVVDNISGGRVGIAFASGWQPNDFVLRPENYADRNAALLRDLDAVRGLWRGEARSFDGPTGPVEVTTLPRPIQAELPYWITSAGNAETFAAAGRAGASILTHLLGQSVDELAEKIRVYRAARREAGHAGEGQVTLMLHSFVGPDADAIREIVRQPLIAYLRTATSLVKQYAWSFPAFKRRAGMADSVSNAEFESLTAEEMEMLLEHAFDRYFEGNGLFGTPEQCVAMVDRLRAVGVDEIASLIDFGVESRQVLAHLPWLNQLRQLCTDASHEEAEPIAALMERHQVTHLQCTPSMMRMLLAEPGARPHIAALDHLMIGGEAFPPDLAEELSGLVRGKVTNMYGPTETTIWSAVHRVTKGGAVPLGAPLANQSIAIMDSRQRPLPSGVPGEILIGGAGVVRGYLNRPELTAERFVADPAEPGARLYRTGDLGRRRRDGTLEFLGRLDHQVKIRGYRIELGEIEALLHQMSEVGEAVVTAIRSDDGEQMLVAYAAPLAANHDFGPMRERLRAELPDFMVPTHYVGLQRLPHTPNGKIDRNALPRPERAAPVSQKAFVAPEDGMEARIAAVWRDVLKLESIGSLDNFFDAGGHSLLAVQMHRRLTAELNCQMALTDIFRFPTIRTLAAHLASGTADDLAAQQGLARAEGRRAAIARRAMARNVMATGDRSSI
ncbi:MupA/Atu3671 family FMN-dependent luciferase-like monooxygenase [Sphingobium bisphenolivorans]|uniref:MupA/Atu3671 family FMN-dependent luciferase-like monooxygenase n=1 Tax=Sphingobium bisphenolivorans TaxID=1335760 RepID=UPI0003A350F8|nr:MupA/Atu3671 family FMN-dependent luciferase-like monooxygenase [Sphingobium bisphenolivorans]